MFPINRSKHAETARVGPVSGVVRFYQKDKGDTLKGILDLSADKICSSGYATFYEENLKAFQGKREDW